MGTRDACAQKIDVVERGQGTNTGAGNQNLKQLRGSYVTQLLKEGNTKMVFSLHI